uniref:C-type lectin domain-containing protein n=1 Tax=Nothobranchius kuhntae TaxID=321403 RepID=A0A1A8J317_NOTKU
MMICPQNSEQGEAAASQHEKPNRKSNLLLGALLAAALIIISILAFDKIRTNKTLQTLKEDNKVLSEETEALRKHISDHFCLKLDRNWEKHGDKCYYFSNLYLPWNESRSFCEDLGADLVKIDSREEQEFLVGKVKAKMEFPEDKFWIGLTDSENESSWIWVDGSPLNTNLTFWSKSEPDNWEQKNPLGEDCVRMGEKGAEDLKCWFDQSCDAPQKSICEKLPITDQKHKCEVQFHKRA